MTSPGALLFLLFAAAGPGAGARMSAIDSGVNVLATFLCAGQRSEQSVVIPRGAAVQLPVPVHCAAAGNAGVHGASHQERRPPEAPPGEWTVELRCGSPRRCEGTVRDDQGAPLITLRGRPEALRHAVVEGAPAAARLAHFRVTGTLAVDASELLDVPLELTSTTSTSGSTTVLRGSEASELASPLSGVGARLLVRFSPRTVGDGRLEIWRAERRIASRLVQHGERASIACAETDGWCEEGEVTFRIDRHRAIARRCDGPPLQASASGRPTVAPEAPAVPKERPGEEPR